MKRAIKHVAYIAATVFLLTYCTSALGGGSPRRFIAFVSSDSVGMISDGYSEHFYYDGYVPENGERKLTAVSNDQSAAAYWVKLSQRDGSRRLAAVNSVLNASPLGGEEFYQPVFLDSDEVISVDVSTGLILDETEGYVRAKDDEIISYPGYEYTLTVKYYKFDCVVYGAESLSYDNTFCDDMTVRYDSQRGLIFTAVSDCTEGNSPNHFSDTSYAPTVMPKNGDSFEVDFKTYPYIVLSYDTDIKTTEKLGSVAMFPFFKAAADQISQRSWSTSGWADYVYQLHPTCIGSAEYNAYVNKGSIVNFDPIPERADEHIYIQGFNFEAYSFTPTTPNGTLPYSFDKLSLRVGYEPFEIKKDNYFAVKWLGFFKTAEDAVRYIHENPNDDLTFEQAPDGYISALDLQFEARKQEVLNTKSEWMTADGGRIWYVSSSVGNDNNDGLSEQTPIKSAARLKSADPKPGDVVLFKRGDTWHLGDEPYDRSYKLLAKSGVTYSAYGEGEKPRLLGSMAGVERGVDHWSLADRSSDMYVFDQSIDAEQDVGNIIFNDGEGFAFRVLKQPLYDKPVACGTDGLVGNGYNTWVMDFEAHSFSGETDLPSLAQAYPEADLMYYHNRETGRLYLISKRGDPDTVFDSIDISTKGNGIRVGGNDVIIDNLAVLYTGAHGISAGSVNNLTVRNCEVGFVGGSVQSISDNNITRYGNTIEIFGGCDGFYVYNNYNHNAFDCGPTVQWQSQNDLGKPLVQKNIEIRDNVLWDAKPEIWLTPFGDYDYIKDTKMENCHVTNNLITAAGYGFTGYFHSKTGYCFFYGAARPQELYYNCSFEGNIFWNARRQIFVAKNIDTSDGKGFNWKNNIIVHRLGGEFGRPDGYPTAPPVTYDKEGIEELVYQGIFGKNTFYYTLP